VRTHSRTTQLLALLVLLAVALTWLISGREGAAAFQSPIPFESELVTPTLEPTASPTGTPYTEITETASPTATLGATSWLTYEPTLEPTPGATSEPAMSATPPGFLPPPTLTSPGTPVPAGAPSPWPEELPVRVAPTETPAAEGTNSRFQTGLSTALARLIDQGVLAMGYLWLCCGVLALLGVGGVLIWFFRRSRRG
jgi:hypothetical protein